MAEKAKTTNRSIYWLVTAGFCYALLVGLPHGGPRECPELRGALSWETISVVGAEEKANPATIREFRVWAGYRAVRLTWEASISEKEQLTFEIYRTMVTPDGEYTLVASIRGTPEVTRYQYIDKTVPVEENYFYKIAIPETKEATGPLQARPPFSAPST